MRKPQDGAYALACGWIFRGTGMESLRESVCHSLVSRVSVVPR